MHSKMGHSNTEELNQDNAAAAARDFAIADDWVSSWQLWGTIGLVAATVFLIGHCRWWLALPLSLPLAGLLVRLFVLEHDCGHYSLFRKRRHNHYAGLLISVFTGVAFELWRSEHNWHHIHQGKLEHRGLDLLNSPMTLDEAKADLKRANYSSKMISFPRVLIYGIVGIIAFKRSARGYLPFNPRYRGEVRERTSFLRNLRFTNLAFALWQLTLLLAVSPTRWLAIVLPAHVIAAATGGLLFWLQHNFEHTYWAAGKDWQLPQVALQGTSWLALPQPWRWFTASIGVHHVHHLHPRIPNYRLEAARRAIPELAAIAPLRWHQLPNSFSHIFWDEAQAKMVSKDSLDGTPK